VAQESWSVRTLTVLGALVTVVVVVVTVVTGALGASERAMATTGCANGPDVSRWQHPNGAAINWSKVAGACNGFAIIKATEATSYTNPYFASDWAAVSNVGLVRGAYHYARPALPYSTAVAQADHYAAVVGDLEETGDLPPMLDLEETGGLSTASLITWAQVFLDELQRDTGRTPAIYTYRYFWWTAMGDTTALTRYPLWIADYSTGITAPHTPLIGSWPTWALWQYSATSSVPGISGPVDMSHFNGTLTDLASFADGTAPSALAIRAPAAPVAVSASATGTTAHVSWQPADNGGTLLARSLVTASPGGANVTVSGTSHTATFSGLQVGTTYRFTVTSTNKAGLVSPVSAPSNAVSTYVPVSLSVAGDLDISYGARTTLTATLLRTDTGASLGSRQVDVYRKPAGWRAWHYLTTVTTSSTGTAAVTLHPSTNVGIRFRVAPSGNDLGTTATRSVTVRPRLTAALSATTVRVGGSVTMRGSVTPVLAGRTVYRQGYYGGAWHTWATATVSSSGTFRFVVTPTVRTTDVYRVFLPASTRLGSARSQTMELTVH
jgi:GH25 family lysozyme M1 (1,4-beta-N-acetylmuramidase)